MKIIFFFIIFASSIFSSTIVAMDYNRVSLISSSTQYDEDKVEKIKQAFEKQGYIVSDKYLNQIVSDFGYVNTDKSRAKNLISAMLDDNVDIIWFVRGGAGAFNLIPSLYAVKEKLMKAKPKILVGFSDVTAIHYFVNSVLGWPSVHGVVASYNKEMSVPNSDKAELNDRQNIPSIKNIFKKGVYYKNLIPLNSWALKGVCGSLIGGNFTLISTFFSTPYEYDLSKKILILEDTGVSFRQLDRTLHQLLYKKDLKASAIIFGQFYSLDPTDEERLIYKTVIKEFAEKIHKPVYYYPFFGHGRENRPFILGKEASVMCLPQEEYCILKEIMLK